MASRALAVAAKGPDDYLRVYERVLSGLSGKAIAITAVGLLALTLGALAKAEAMADGLEGKTVAKPTRVTVSKEDIIGAIVVTLVASFMVKRVGAKPGA